MSLGAVWHHHGTVYAQELWQWSCKHLKDLSTGHEAQAQAGSVRFMLEMCLLAQSSTLVCIYRKQNWTNWVSIAFTWWCVMYRASATTYFTEPNMKKKKTELIAAITWTHKQHTHTPLLSLFTPQLLRYMFVLCSCGSGSCLLMALFKTRPPRTIFCSLSCFLFVTSPLTWVCCAFSFGRLNVCFAACTGCFVQHIKRIYTHTHSASLSLGHMAIT